MTDPREENNMSTPPPPRDVWGLVVIMGSMIKRGLWSLPGLWREASIVLRRGGVAPSPLEFRRALWGPRGYEGLFLSVLLISIIAEGLQSIVGWQLIHLGHDASSKPGPWVDIAFWMNGNLLAKPLWIGLWIWWRTRRLVDSESWRTNWCTDAESRLRIATWWLRNVAVAGFFGYVAGMVFYLMMTLFLNPGATALTMLRDLIFASPLRIHLFHYDEFWPWILAAPFTESITHALSCLWLWLTILIPAAAFTLLRPAKALLVLAAWYLIRVTVIDWMASVTISPPEFFGLSPDRAQFLYTAIVGNFNWLLITFFILLTILGWLRPRMFRTHDTD